MKIGETNWSQVESYLRTDDRAVVPLPVVIPEDDDKDPVQEFAQLRVVRMDGLRVDRLTIRRVDTPSVPAEAGEQT